MCGILSIPTRHPFMVAFPAEKRKVLAITVYPIPFFAFLRVWDAVFVCDSNSNVTNSVRSPFALWAKFH